MRSAALPVKRAMSAGSRSRSTGGMKAAVDAHDFREARQPPIGDMSEQQQVTAVRAANARRVNSKGAVESAVAGDTLRGAGPARGALSFPLDLGRAAFVEG